jgi:hypothetical protein
MAEGGAKMDMPAHERTYERFISVSKVGAVIVALIAFAVILIISR